MNEGPTIDQRLHFVATTAIVVKAGRFLIAKRAGWEKMHPNRWTVPGGKLKLDEYKAAPMFFNQYYNVAGWVVKKEVKEEVGLEIDDPKYVCDLVAIRPDGYPVLVISYWANHKNGEVKLSDELTDHAWVTLEEAKNYDLIEGIWDELKIVAGLIKQT